LLSSHILPEVEVTCSRVLILHQGRILAADTTENLQKTMSDRGQVVAEIAAPINELKAAWEQIPEIEYFNVEPIDGEFMRCSLTPRPGADIRLHIFMLVREHGWVLRELTRRRHSLEDIFVRVTGPNKEEENT
jgi:ABC-2 type transport system ATP-binding protein